MNPTSVTLPHMHASSWLGRFPVYSQLLGSTLEVMKHLILEPCDHMCTYVYKYTLTPLVFAVRIPPHSVGTGLAFWIK